MSLDEKTNVQPPAEPVKENFLPPSDWDRQKESDTLILMLPGFTKEQLKVQVSHDRVLRLSGKRKMNENKLRRFRMEEPLSKYHDTSGISARFEAGMLYVKLPKVFKPQPQPTQQEPYNQPQQPTTTDHKPDTPQQQHAYVDEKEREEGDKSDEESKTPPPPPQEPKADNNEDFEKEMNIAEAKSRSCEAEEMNGTTQMKEDDEDSQKKEKDKAVSDGNEMEEANKGSKAERTSPDGLIRRASLAKMSKNLDMISDLVLQVHNQNKVPHFLLLVFLVLFIGLYIKTLFKSSFGVPKNFQDL